MSNAARIARRIAAKRPRVTVKESGPGCEVGLLDQRGRRVPDAYLVGTIGARDDVVSSLLDQNQLDPDGEVGEYLSSFVRERRGTVASIDWMSVPEGMRRRGLGSAMVGAFLARAKAKGAKSVYVLASSPDETDAPAFYESLGFGLEGSFGEGEMMRLSFGVASAEAGGEHPAKRGARCGNARTAWQVVQMYLAKPLGLGRGRRRMACLSRSHCATGCCTNSRDTCAHRRYPARARNAGYFSTA